MGPYDTLNKLEELRKKLNMYYSFLFATFLLYIIPVFLPGLSEIFMLFAVGATVGFIMISARSKKVTDEFKRLYKETFVVQLLSERFNDVVYDWEKGLNLDFIRSFKVVRQGNRFKTEDYLCARYNGVRFEQADVTIQYHSSGKNSHTTTYFKGRMFVFDFPSKNVASVRVFANSFMYRASSNNKKVNLENVDFNKRFDTDAFYEHDAFYFLTPQMMERIESLNNRYGKVAVHLMGNKLFVAINMSSDAFDHNIRQPIDYPTESAKINADMQVIVDIIDTLSLYT
ncbi:MAG: DUF3137 domain-containing protein [Lachnospiraceae bacterium]|nr:DUF3137 domain-containing protein [Lachnospiraceae bacterium]